MIAYLEGQILAHTKDGAIVQVGSLGYEIIGLWLGRQVVGTKLSMYIYEYLENQSIPRMVGCPTLQSRDLFLQLLGVSGVGPKMASRIIDSMPEDKLVTTIKSGDIDALSSVKGLGKKTAQKIVLELGKILVTDVSSANSALYDALTSLRFTVREIDKAIEQTSLAGLSENEKITALLKALGRTK